MISCILTKPGDKGTITALKTDDATTIHRLLAMGVTPGSPILIEQAFPAYILKVGRTRITLDREIAKTIAIQLDPTMS